jgi:DNA modification methylase
MNFEINKFYQGNAREILKSFPAQVVDCVVTSPPYWGLRNYGTAPQIWGGDPACEHEWNKIIKPPNGGKNNPERPPNVASNRHMDAMDVRGSRK